MVRAVSESQRAGGFEVVLRLKDGLLENNLFVTRERFETLRSELSGVSVRREWLVDKRMATFFGLDRV
jgi:hypothetical protein